MKRKDFLLNNPSKTCLCILNMPIIQGIQLLCLTQITENALLGLNEGMEEEESIKEWGKTEY